MPDITTEADSKLLSDSFSARVLADPLLAILRNDLLKERDIQSGVMSEKGQRLLDSTKTPTPTAVATTKQRTDNAYSSLLD